MLWVSKLIIDGVVGWISRGSGNLASIWRIVALELALAVDGDVRVIFQDYMRYDLVVRENIGFGEVDSLGDRRRVESAAVKSLAKLTRERMAVLISHRFSTVCMADRILVLVDGSIREQGTHEQLPGLGGRYAELFELQAAGYR